MTENIKRQIIELYNSPEYLSLSAYYGRRTCFDILGVGRSEDAHSNFLAWLLSPAENHTLDAYPVQKFLQLLVMARNDYPCNFSVPFDEEFQNNLLLENWQIENVCVSRETFVQSSKKGRIDILLEITFCGNRRIYPVVIENKVKSDEHDNQSDKYYEWAREHYKDSNKCVEPVYVFLTPKIDFSIVDETSRTNICKNPNYILINYQNIVDYLLEPCLKKGMSKQGELLTLDYLRCLSYRDPSKMDGELIMAYSSEEKKLLRQFWNKNSQLLLAAIKVLCTDDEIDDSEKQKMNKTIKVLEKHRDNRKYLFNGKEYGKSPLVQAVVNAYISEKKPLTVTDLEKFFPKELQGPMGVFQKIEEIKLKYKSKAKDYFFVDKPIALGDGTEIAVCREWAINNIPKFVSHVNDNLGEAYYISEAQ